HLVGRLHARAVDVHAPAARRLGGERTRAEQPHREQPAVQARGAVRSGRGRCTHRPKVYLRPMNQTVIERLRGELQGLREQGLYKGERVLEGPQGGVVHAGGRDLINLCANNYLGLANHPQVRAAAQRALDEYGYGMASVRFICGTQSIHKTLEQLLARFLGTEDVILYSSCFDANGGLFETLLDERDAVISDALNHASIIDGIRLSKAQRLRYANSDMAELERCL